MRTILIRDYEPEDFMDISDRCEPMKEDRETQWAYAMRHKQATHAETFVVDGKVAACGGFHKLWDGTAEVWLVLADDFKNSPSVVMKLKERLDTWMYVEHFVRLQALCKQDWLSGRRFLEWLGMKYEATLRKMGPNGVDQTLYAKVL